MPRGGAKPGERRGGKQKVTKNKRTVADDRFLMRGGFANAANAQNDFSVIDQMETICKLYLGRAAAEQKKGDRADQKVMEGYLNKAQQALNQLAPYKHPRLASLKVDGVMRHDLTQLSEAELLTLRRIVGKTAIE
jgi:hypothetical protein